MRGLIPEIVIGKEYRWRDMPIEQCCPNCGVVTGWKTPFRGGDKLLVKEALMGLIAVFCEGCRTEKDEIHDGWYRVSSSKHQGDFAVPYTQLEEVEAEGLT